METNVIAPRDGEIEKVYIKAGEQVKAGQLVAILKSEDE